MTATTLVTGGTGFIGQAVVNALASHSSDRIRVLDVREPPPSIADRADFMLGSILDENRLRTAIEGCERVFHLAGIPELWLPDKSEFARVNTLGTERVLSAAARAGVKRFVYTSTESILVGTHRKQSKVDENSRLSIADMPGPYCRSKFLAEQAARKAAQDGQPVVIVNPALPIGPGDHRLTPPSRMLLGFLNRDYSAYLDSAFNLIDVRDIAEGHIRALQRGRVGERYLLAGENLRLSELLELLQELTGIEMPRRRVPWFLAFGFAALSEWIADHITHKSPSAPLTGVRLARHPMLFDNQKARYELSLTLRPIREALREALEDFHRRGLIHGSQLAFQD